MPGEPAPGALGLETELKPTGYRFCILENKKKDERKPKYSTSDFLFSLGSSLGKTFQLWGQSALSCPYLDNGNSL